MRPIEKVLTEIRKKDIMIRPEKPTNYRSIVLKIVNEEPIVETKTKKKFQIKKCMDKDGEIVRWKTWGDEITKIKLGKTYRIQRFFPKDEDGLIILNLGKFGECEEVTNEVQ